MPNPRERYRYSKFPVNRTRRLRSSVTHPKSILISIILFAIWFILLANWLNEHLSLYKYFNILVNAIVAVVVILLKFFDKSIEEWFYKEAKPWVAFFVSSKVLFALYTSLIFVSLFISSVTFNTKGITNTIKIVIHRENSIISTDKKDSILLHPNKIYKRVQLINPLGNSFEVFAEGYLTTTALVNPWSSTRVAVKTEFKPSPKLLVRLPDVRNLYEQGKIIVIINGDSSNILMSDSLPIIGSFFIGGQFKHPLQWEANWVDFLSNSNKKKRLLDGWKNPSNVLSQIVLEPGDVLDISVKNNNDFLAASKSYIVTNDQYQNILLEK